MSFLRSATNQFKNLIENYFAGLTLTEQTQLDEIDINILKILQNNCRTPMGKIAKKIGIPKSTVHYRIKKLEGEGIIEGYYAKLNANMLGKDYTTITFVRGKFGPKYHQRIGSLLADIPGVTGVYFILGEQDFVFLCTSNNRQNFMEKLEKIYDMQEIERTSTLVVMKTIKEDPKLDLESIARA